VWLDGSQHQGSGALMTNTNTLLTVGLACIVAAIFGGGLKAFGFEIPAIQSTTQQILLGAFGLLLLLGLGTYESLPYIRSATLPTGGAGADSPSPQQSTSNPSASIWKEPIYVEYSDSPESRRIAQALEERLDEAGFKIAPDNSKPDVDMDVKIDSALVDQPNSMGNPNFKTSLIVNAREEPGDKPLPLFDVSFVHIIPAPDKGTAEGYALDQAVGQIKEHHNKRN